MIAVRCGCSREFAYKFIITSNSLLALNTPIIPCLSSPHQNLLLLTAFYLQ